MAETHLKSGKILLNGDSEAALALVELRAESAPILGTCLCATEDIMKNRGHAQETQSLLPAHPESREGNFPGDQSSQILTQENQLSDGTTSHVGFER